MGGAEVAAAVIARSEATKQSTFSIVAGLLRFARNDELAG
jgi:hypothetical protein